MVTHQKNTLDKKFQKEMNAGITGLVLLSVLNQTGKPMYGYQITKLLETDQETSPTFKQGALYPVLRQMEKNGLLESTVEPSTSGPPRRYYSITDAGKQTLESWIEIWGQTSNFVENILEGVEDVQ